MLFSELESSIASEPDLDVDHLPKLLVDTATRKAMSGSEVFARHSGRLYQIGADTANIGQAIIGTSYEFVGWAWFKRGSQSNRGISLPARLHRFLV
jgi:hypothetical protein